MFIYKSICGHYVYTPHGVLSTNCYNCQDRLQTIDLTCIHAYYSPRDNKNNLYMNGVSIPSYEFYLRRVF